MTLIKAIEHVQIAIPSGEEDRAREFYSGLLELTEVPKPAAAGRGGAWFEAGQVRVHVGSDPEFRPAQKAHPAFVVDALEPLAERIRAAGLGVVDGTRLPGYERLFVFDPFGNRLEFMAPVRDPSPNSE